MRICQVVASWDKGGLEKHVIDLSNALAEEHEVAVVVHPQLQQAFSPKVQVLPINFELPRWSPRLHWQLRQMINQWQPDIIHAQANKAATLIGRLRPWLQAKGYVATLHNQKGSTKMYERFDRTIVVSPNLAPLVKNVPVTPIYNGIKPPVAPSITRENLVYEFGFAADKPIFIAVGRLVVAKGFDILVQAAGLAGAQILIVGEGDLRPTLEQQIKNLPTAKIVLAGFRADAQQLMAVADGFILSSRNEGFAYVFVEALLARQKIIATQLPMVQDFLPSSLIVPVEDIQALANKLQWAMAQPEQWNQDMQACWQKAEQELTLEAMCLKNQQVYKGLVQ